LRAQRSKMLDAGCWMLDAGSSGFEFKFRIYSDGEVGIGS